MDSPAIIGQTIAHFKIEAKAGQDATGTLFRAVDTFTNRPVSVKALAPAAVPGEDRRRQAARIENPHIARIIEVFRSGELEFIAMEAIEGESLYEFLDRERPTRRVLVRLAGQIAGALETAHAAGIAHGPLNPANIFISATNDVKIYDFGVAAIAPPPASDAERAILFGESAGYISPEQISGDAPDVRSDIFSFGALMYHMTTGRPPFRGATISETWRAIIEDDPKPVAQLTSRYPPGMDKLLERCLRKNPERRYQKVGEIAPLIENMAAVYLQNSEQTPSAPPKKARFVRIGVIAAFTAASVAATVLWWRSEPARDTAIGKQVQQFTAGAGYNTDPAISRDGARIAYASDRGGGGNLDIWIQPADGDDPRRLTSDPADDREPAFSPNGETIAFRSDRDGGGIYIVSAAGGEARLLAGEGRRPRYSPDGEWIAYWVGPHGLATATPGAFKVSVIRSSGGEPRQIRPDFFAGADPVWSPDGKSLLFLGKADAGGGANALDWWIASVDGGQLRNTEACRLFHRLDLLSAAQYGIPGDWIGKHVYFWGSGAGASNIWRAQMEGTSPVGIPRKITSSVEEDSEPSVSASGLMVFGRRISNVDIWDLPTDVNAGKPAGAARRRTQDHAYDTKPSLTSDGSKILFESNRSGRRALWLLDVNSGKESPLNPSEQDRTWPVISPDGAKVAYTESRIRKYEHFLAAAGGGAGELLCDDCGPSISGWSPDSSLVLIDAIGATRPRLAVAAIRIADRRKSILLDDPKRDLGQASISPDGRSIAFTATSSSGLTQLYSTPYHERPPFRPEAWIALTDGKSWDTRPQWSPDGKVIYFASARDGQRCIWAQRLDAAGRPVGAAFAVYHFHNAGRSPAQVGGGMDLFVGRDRILVSLGELSGNIWSAKTPD